jgi:hypothetical protein
MDDTITRYQGGTPPGANQKPVNLALQGGGSHGAFAWGVHGNGPDLAFRRHSSSFRP